MKQFLLTFVIKTIGLQVNILGLFSPKLAAKKALRLFSTPRSGKITENQKSFLDTAQSKILHYQDLPIMTYHWQGKKQTILLMHGWESNAYRWHRLVKALKEEDYNIVALDAPAHGASGSLEFNAPLYADFINEVVKIHQPTVIIGHSVGGMASVFFLERYKYDAFDKLILLGAPSEFTKIFANYTSLLGYNSRVKKALYKHIEERFKNTPESFSTAKKIQHIRTNGLIIHDKDDKIVHYSEAETISKSFKNSKLVLTEGLGHSLYQNSVTSEIITFINS